MIKRDNRPDVIHETILKDIVDVLSDVKDNDEVQMFTNARNNRSFSSLAKASNNLTLVFPVLASTNCALEDAIMVTKAIERKCVSMLQMVLSALSMEAAKDGIDYLRNFHTNLKIGSSVEDYMNAMDKFAKINETSMAFQEMVRTVKEDMKNINYTLDEDINETAIGDYAIHPETAFREETIVKTTNFINEAVPNPNTKITTHVATSKDYSTKRIVTPRGSSSSRDNGRAIRDLLAGGKSGGTDNTRDRNRELKDQLLPSDVKKANELVPSMMIVNFLAEGRNGSANAVGTMVIGVKAKLYPVNASELIKRLASKHKDSNTLLSFIKASTREMSFLKDFIFAIDKAKSDALASSVKSKESPLWKLLERRAMKSKVRTGLKMKNDATAITTLLLTSEDASDLVKDYGVDIMNASVARSLMNAYNLLGMSVIDTSLESVDFIWDTGDDIYEKLSFRSLERESDNKEFKKVISLMTKVG